MKGKETGVICLAAFLVSFIFLFSSVHITFAEQEGSIYVETSAKTGINVDDAFTELTRRIVESRTQ